MIDHDAIIADLKDQKLTQKEIAQKHNVSLATIARDVKKYGLQIGRGNRPQSLWEFSPSSDLAYIVGIFITDGYISRDYYSHHPKQVSITSTTPEIIHKTTQSFKGIGLVPNIRNNGLSEYGHKDRINVQIYHTAFSTWLNNVCHYKSRIPDFLYTAPLDHQLSFLAGVIDGDGYVQKDGTIKVRGVDTWLNDLPDLLAIMHIKTTGVSPVETLDSGKIYLGIYINRSDYRSLGGTAHHPMKKQRIATGKDKRSNRKVTPPRYKCPECGQMNMTNKNAKSCRACYLQSERFHDHLCNISPRGNIAANKARWGG